MPRLSSTQIAAEIIAALLKGPRTWPDLQQMVGLCEASALRWKQALRASGVLRVCGWSQGDTGRPAAVYELQKPFEREDEPRPGPKEGKA